MSQEKISVQSYFDQAINNIKEATRIALSNLERRLDNMNEWRLESKDRQAEFPTRIEIENQFKGIKKDLEDIEKQVSIMEISAAKLDGKASQKSVDIALFFTATSLLIALFSILLKFL